MTMRDVHPIGPLKPWACSYTDEFGRRMCITLWATDWAELEEEQNKSLRDFVVDGLLLAEGDWHD